MSGVYGLSSSRDRKIRYIGKADNLDRRENVHRFRESQPQLDEWLRSERKWGFDLVFDIIEYCSNPLYRESYWLDRLPNLLNDRKYRKWLRISANTEDELLLHRLRKRRLGYVENWQGYIGLRYYPRDDAYRMHIQTLGSHAWLMGDGGSCLQIGQYYTWKFGHTYAFGDHFFLHWPQ